MPDQVDGIEELTPEQELEAQEELAAAVAEVTTDSAINTSLEDVSDVDTLKKMVKKLRNENARARTKNNEERAELAEFVAWKESQMTEQERLEARVKAAEERAAAAERKSILSEFGIDEDLAEFVTGTPEEMRQKAERLASRVGKSGSSVPQIFDQSNKAPVKPRQDDGASFLQFLADNGRFSL